METQIEVQMALNRLNLVEQEILRLEQEVDDQKVIEADCDAITERLNNRLFSQNSTDDYHQRMRQLKECADRKIVALEKDLKLGRQLRQLREERGQLMARIKSFSTASHYQPTLQPSISNLYQETGSAAARYDVFISHATEDKESFVNALVEELTKRNVQVWVDALRVQWGDPLRKTIDEGLKKSRFGIVVISKHFIAKGWTQYELDGLFEREMTQGKVILPIWHNISKEEVQDFSPSLAGRKAMITSEMTPSDIAGELVLLLSEEKGKAQ